MSEIGQKTVFTELAKRMAETLNGGMFKTPDFYNGDQPAVWQRWAEKTYGDREQYHNDRHEAAADVHAKLIHQIAEMNEKMEALRAELEGMTAVKDIHQIKRHEYFCELTRALEELAKHNV